MLKNKNIQILISIILSFFSSITIFCNRNLEINSIHDFANAINCNIVSTTLVVILLAIVYFKFLNKKYQKNILWFSVILSIIFSLCELIGFYMDTQSAFFNLSMNKYTILFNLIVFLGYICLLFPFTTIVLDYSLNINCDKLNYKNNHKYFSDNLQSVFLVSAILILLWGIYYLIFFPGVVTWDTYYQIEQGLNFVPLTDEHPFLHTLIEGNIIKLGNIIFGNISAGIALFTFIQMTCIAFIVSLIIRYLARKQVPSTIRFITLLFFALHPIIAAYSVTLWKDVWMGVFVLIYIIFLFEICNNPKKFFQSKTKFILFTLSILCILFAKGTGIIIIVLSFPTLFIFSKKSWKQLLLSAGICFTIFFLVRSVIIPGLNIIPGHIREPFSVPIQQISRTVKYHKDSLTEYEYNTINEILPIEELDELYHPKLSDYTKGVLNEENFSKDKMKYAKVWFNLGLKHPKTYMDSFLANSYGYWYPETTYHVIANSDYIKMLDFYESNNWTIYDTNYDKYSTSPKLDSVKNHLCNIINDLSRKIPIINLLFSIGIYFWIDLICLTISIIKKKYYLIPVFLTMGAVFLICISSPLHAECRYAYPTILTLPIIIIYSILNFKNDKSKSN